MSRSCDRGDHDYMDAEKKFIYETPGVSTADQPYRVAGERVTKLVCRVCALVIDVSYER